MGYGATSGAPTIQTGNPQWDRNLGGLAHIFGTPGGYERGLAAGAQAREALLKGDQAISERAAAQRLAEALQRSDMTGGPVQPPVPTYHPSGVAGGGLIMDPSPTSIVTPSPVQAPQSRSLWDMITGQNRSQPTPPASSPAPNAGAPAAPNTTASDGTVPANSQPPDRTLNTTGGGQHYAPAANSDGSPRPGLNLQTILGLAVLAGQNPEMVKATLGAVIAGGREHGLIPWTNASPGAPYGTQGQSGAVELAALMGNTAPYGEVQGTIRNAATNATTIQREQIQQGAENYRFAETGDPNLTTRDAAGNPVIQRRALTPGGPLREGGPGFSQPLTQQQQGLTQTGGAGPFGTGGQYQRQGDVKPGTPVYDEATNRLMNTMLPDGVVIGGVAKGMTYGEYMQIPLAQRPPLSEKNMEAVRANTVTQAIATGDTGPAKTARGAAIQAEVPKPRTEDESKAWNAQIDTTMQRRFAPREGTSVYNTTRGEPALIGDDTRAAVGARAQDLLDQGVVRNPDQAINQAIDELTQTGHIQKPEDLQAARGKGANMANPNIRTLKNAKGVDVPVFHVPLAKPYQPGAVQLAPPGAQDGALSKDRKYQVRNGFWYPYTAQ